MEKENPYKCVEINTWQPEGSPVFYWYDLKTHNGFIACTSKTNYRRLYDCKEKATELAECLGTPVVRVRGT